MFWTLELASYLEDAPWPATKDELIDYAIRSGDPIEVVENLQELEDEGEIYEGIDDIWPDYPSQEDFFSSIVLISACVTPVKENPPSWNRFCIVAILERSLNKLTQ